MPALRQMTPRDAAIGADLLNMPACIHVPAGTPVLTLRGPCDAGSLRRDDRLITRAGALRLAGVTVHLERRTDLLRVSACALGHDRPEGDLVLRADQPILLRDWRAQALFGAPRVVVPLHRLIDGLYIRRDPAADLRMVCLSLPREAVIYAGGLELASSAVAADVLS